MPILLAIVPTRMLLTLLDGALIHHSQGCLRYVIRRLLKTLVEIEGRMHNHVPVLVHTLVKLLILGRALCFNHLVNFFLITVIKFNLTDINMLLFGRLVLPLRCLATIQTNLLLFRTAEGSIFEDLVAIAFSLTLFKAI